MFASIAGATRIGAVVASTVANSASSPNPHDSFAIASAVAGATTTMSALFASATWSIARAESDSHRLLTTGRCVMARNVTGEMK